MDLSKLKLPDLKALCKQHAIPQYSKCNKQPLIEKLAAAGITSYSPAAAAGAQGSQSQSHSQTQTQPQSQSTSTPPQASGTTSTTSGSSGNSNSKQYGDGGAKIQEQVAVKAKKGGKSTGKTKSAKVPKPISAFDAAKQPESAVITEQIDNSNAAPAITRSSRAPEVPTAVLVKHHATPPLGIDSWGQASSVSAAGPQPHSSAESSISKTAIPKLSTSKTPASSVKESIAKPVKSAIKAAPLLKSAPDVATATHVTPSAPSLMSPNKLAIDGTQQSSATARIPPRTTTTPPLTAPSTARKTTATAQVLSKRSAASLSRSDPVKRVRVQLALAPPSKKPTSAALTSQSAFKPASSALPPLVPEDLTTPNRTYIRTHFLSSLYANIDAARAHPTGQSFSSLDSIMDAPIPAFRAAVRLYVARLHTLFMLGKVDFGRVEAVERVKGDVFCVTLGNVLPDGERDGGGEGTTRSSGAAGNTKGAKGKSGGKRSPQTSDSAVRQSGGGGEKFWFIGTTGEVIPHDRVDWATFLSSDDEPGSWLQYVKTKDGTPAPGRPGGLTGPGKGMVAELVERVVLANCALNSFSGDKVSALQMDSEFLGQPAAHTSAALEFYLAESHQLLSLHPTPHPAIIIAHLRHASFYVLRDTGQIIGHEDGDGVVDLWRGILGCGAKGEKDEGTARAFWEGWEERWDEMQAMRLDW